MAILSIKTVQTGLVGVLPSIAYINTTNTVAEVMAAGFLNKEVANGAQFSLPCLAIVSTRSTPTAAPVAGVYNVVHSGEDWSLAASSNDQIALPSGQILVGNAGGVATPVAMSGDGTISNTGVFAIAAGVIVNADINASAAIAFSKLAALPSAQILVGSAGNVPTAVAMSGDISITNAGLTAIGAGKVLLAMLGSGIAPAGVIKFMGQVTTVGGAAAEAFTVTGAVGATDRAFVQVVDDGTANVTVLQAVVTDNTLTVTFSANPGNDAVINYQIVRAAS